MEEVRHRYTKSVIIGDTEVECFRSPFSVNKICVRITKMGRDDESCTQLIATLDYDSWTRLMDL